MIEKKRLEELIEQGAIIYAVIKEPFIAGYSSFLKITPIKLNNCYGISVETYNKINKCTPKFYYLNGITRDICDADEIFETKEEAEWYLEFGNIKITKKLTLPTWEEFSELDKLIENYEFQFYGNNKVTYLLYFTYNHNEILIWNNTEGRVEFNKKATKENYLEACRLAKKLFLGEKE